MLKCVTFRIQRALALPSSQFESCQLTFSKNSIAIHATTPLSFSLSGYSARPKRKLAREVVKPARRRRHSGIMRDDRVLARARPRTIEAIDREARQTTSTSACLSSSRCHRGHPHQTQNLPSLCLRVPSSSSLVCVIIFSPRIVIYPLDSCGCAPINPYSSF